VRSLSPEEAELWERVAATIRPLSREKHPKVAEIALSPHKRADAKTAISSPPQDVRYQRSGNAAATPLQGHSAPATLDSHWDRRLRSGAVNPDRILDFHGQTLDQAWHSIETALEQAIERGERVLLLITGHARSGEPPVARGKIRAVVHDWLAASRHAANIAAVRSAHRHHGGVGSLYVILRQSRRNSNAFLTLPI
jgi:DNA-nicking Smr family endonuclease